MAEAEKGEVAESRLWSPHDFFRPDDSTPYKSRRPPEPVRTTRSLPPYRFREPCSNNPLRSLRNGTRSSPLGWQIRPYSCHCTVRLTLVVWVAVVVVPLTGAVDSV